MDQAYELTPSHSVLRFYSPFYSRRLLSPSTLPLYSLLLLSPSTLPLYYLLLLTLYVLLPFIGRHQEWRSAARYLLVEPIERSVNRMCSRQLAAMAVRQQHRIGWLEPRRFPLPMVRTGDQPRNTHRMRVVAGRVLLGGIALLGAPQQVMGRGTAPWRFPAGQPPARPSLSLEMAVEAEWKRFGAVLPK